VEGRLSVDHEALRIGCPETPGWGRHGLAYGPFQRRDGLAFGALVLNGHNASRTAAHEYPLIDYVRRTVWRLRGFIRNNATQVLERVGLVQPPKKTRPRHFWVPTIRDNLAVGWFDSEAPSNPAASAHSWIVRSADGSCGDLCVSLQGSPTRLLLGFQNVPVHYVVVLRADGAAYYAASLPGVPGLTAHPHLTPIAIDIGTVRDDVYAGVHQSILGEINFRCDTRVYDCRMALVSEWSAWYGTAHAADTLIGLGPLAEATANTGQPWRIARGNFQRSTEGLTPNAPDSVAWLNPEADTGLIHFRFELEGEGASLGPVFRAASDESFWAVKVARQSARLLRVRGGRTEELAWARATLHAGENALQLWDDGERIEVHLNGQRLLGGAFDKETGPRATGVGLWLTGEAGLSRISRFEAHPRSIPVPAELDPGRFWLPHPVTDAVVDDFEGPPGDLEGRDTSFGQRSWRRVVGRGVFEVSEAPGARVRASRETPNPGRTAYAIDWDDPNYAEVQVDITPPGGRKGDGELGRGGLLFYQDPANYIIINNWNDDRFDGSSISSFFVLGGEEDTYDAIWTNVGQRIRRGHKHRLRAVFDGVRYMVYLNDEPVLYRALTDVYPHCKPLQVRAVGIVANWEFGDDTGSRFHHFVARRRSQ
jgi:hypothetical protein